jgi:hypothetical protein
LIYSPRRGAGRPTVAGQPTTAVRLPRVTSRIGGGAVATMISEEDRYFGDMGRSRQVWRRRQAHIERFTGDQRLKRDWINFAEIAEWFTDLAGPQRSNEDARAEAYRRLQQDMLDGDFEQNGRSAAHLLHPRLTRRMQSDFRSMLEALGEAKIRLDVLPYCWMQRSLFDRWCVKHHLPASPARFEPKHRSASSPTTAIYHTGLPGKPTSIPLVRKELYARAERKETAETLEKEASALSEWLRKAHPTAPPATTKTIKNALRREYHSLKSKKAQK